MTELTDENRKIADYGRFDSPLGFALAIQTSTARIGDDLNRDILEIIDGLMGSESPQELALLDKLSRAVESYEKARYPALSVEEAE
jgi:hypothetical protein